MATTAAERQPVLNRLRRKLVHASNKSTALKLMGSDFRTLFDEIDDLHVQIDRANGRADAAEEREAVAVVAQAAAEGKAADALAGTVTPPKGRAKAKAAAPDPVYVAIIAAAHDVNVDLSELWERPLIDALHGWEDYNGPLPDGWEDAVAKAIADRSS